MLSWKWGILGFAAVPYAAVAVADTVAALARVVATGFGYEMPYPLLSQIQHLGALPTLPLVDLSLLVLQLTDSRALAVVASYALLFACALAATTIVRAVQKRFGGGAPAAGAGID